MTSTIRGRSGRWASGRRRCISRWSAGWSRASWPRRTASACAATPIARSCSRRTRNSIRPRSSVFPNGYDSDRLPPREELLRGRPADGLLRIVHAGKFYDTWGRMDRTALSATLKSAYDATLGRLRYSPRGAGHRRRRAALSARRTCPCAAARSRRGGSIRMEFIGRTHRSVREQRRGTRTRRSRQPCPARCPTTNASRKCFRRTRFSCRSAAASDDACMAWLPLKLYDYHGYWPSRCWRQCRKVN